MNLQNLDRANKIFNNINELTKSLIVFETAISDVFKERKMSVNILNTRQDEGFAEIPASISKAVAMMAVFTIKKEINELQKEFDSL